MLWRCSRVCWRRLNAVHMQTMQATEQGFLCLVCFIFFLLWLYLFILFIYFVFFLCICLFVYLFVWQVEEGKDKQARHRCYQRAAIVLSLVFLLLTVGVFSLWHFWNPTPGKVRPLRLHSWNPSSSSTSSFQASHTHVLNICVFQWCSRLLFQLTNWLNRTIPWSRLLSHP